MDVGGIVVRIIVMVDLYLPTVADAVLVMWGDRITCISFPYNNYTKTIG